MKYVDLIVIFLCFVQMIVAIIITKKNKGIFDKFPAHRYFEAFVLLKNRKPLMAYTLFCMYALIPLGFLVIYVFFS